MKPLATAAVVRVPRDDRRDLRQDQRELARNVRQ
jgi:hypothetical protein